MSEMIRYLTKKFSSHTITEVKPVGDRTFTIHGYSPHPAEVDSPKPEASRSDKKYLLDKSSSEDEEISAINKSCDDEGSQADTRASPTRPVLTRPTPTRPTPTRPTPTWSEVRQSPQLKELRQSPIKPEIRQSPQHFKDVRQSPQQFKQQEFPLKICPVPLISGKNRLTPPLKQFEMKLPGLSHRPHKPETQRPDGQRSVPRFETIRQRNKQSVYLSNNSIPQIRHKHSAFSETYPSIEGVGIKPHSTKTTNKRINNSKPTIQTSSSQKQPLAPTLCKYSPKLKEKFISHMNEKQKESGKSSPTAGKCSPTQMKMIVRECTPSPKLEDTINIVHYMKGPSQHKPVRTPPRTPSPKYMDDSGYQTPTSCHGYQTPTSCYGYQTPTCSQELDYKCHMTHINPDYSEPKFVNKRPLSPIIMTENIKCYSAPPDSSRDRVDNLDIMGDSDDERKLYHQKRLNISNDLKRKYSVVPVDDEVRSICGTAFTTAFLLTASQSGANQKTIDISVLRPNKRVCCTDGNSPPSTRRPSINMEKMAQTVLIRRPVVRKAGHGPSFKVWSTKEARRPAFRAITDPPPAAIQPEYFQHITGT